MGYKSIGRKIQLAREQTGYSQEQLAAKIGCSQSTLSNYEKGKRRIYLAQLEKIANILHRPIEYFLQPVEDEAVRAESRAEPVADFTKPKMEQHCYQEIANKNPAHPPVAAGQEDNAQLKNLLAAYKMLSPEGKRLAVNFVVWLQKREVGNNG